MKCFRSAGLSPVFFGLLFILLLAHAPSAFTRDFREPLKEGILLVAFGASVPEARVAYDKIDAAYRKAFPGIPLEWAFTSSIIRKKLKEKGLPAKSVGEGLDALAEKGVDLVRAQSLHLLAGAEFSKFVKDIGAWEAANGGRLQGILPGRPLLESRADGETLARALSGAFPREKDVALLFMAHGNDGGIGGLALEGIREVLRKEDSHVFLATVEGEQDFAGLLQELRESGAKKVILAPFLLVAGHHARNDMAGKDPDSWASRLRKEGYEVKAHNIGLGELPETAAILIDHTHKAKGMILHQ